VGTFILGAVLGTIVYYISGGGNRALLGFVDGLFSLALGSILSAIVLNWGSKEELLTFKRMMAMVNIGMLLLGIGLVVSSIFANLYADPYLLEKGYFVSCGILTSYLFIILAAITNKKVLQLLLLTVSQPIIIISLHVFILFVTNNSYLLNANLFIMFLITVIITLLLSRWYFNTISNVGKELIGYSSTLILQAFIEALLLDKTGLLEMILKAVAEESDIEIKTFYFENDNQKGMIVAPFFHPGPFRDIGSSKLPTRIAVEFLKKEIFPIVFHTPTTHEKDLILKNDCERVMETIFSSDNDHGSMVAYPMIVGKSGNITITTQIFDEVPLVVISRSPLPTEDLPEYVNTFCMEKLIQIGYSDGAIVDAHNSMVANFTKLTEEDSLDITKALEEALEKAKDCGQGTLKAGFSNIRLDKYSIKEGIGEAGIMAMVTEVNGIKGAFVSVDGNNMVVGLRDKIKEALSALGYDRAEITTTDTHVVTGHTGGEGYFPLGKAIPEADLVEKIIEAVGKADSRKTECSVKFSKRKVESVYLLGNRGLENLWKVTNDSMKVAKRRLMVLLMLLIAIGSFLYYIF
jgi:putative membrane protein